MLVAIVRKNNESQQVEVDVDLSLEILIWYQYGGCNHDDDHFDSSLRRHFSSFTKSMYHFHLKSSLLFSRYLNICLDFLVT